MAGKYAIASLEEAKAYLARPVLGARLRACTQLVLNAKCKSAFEIFGTPDELKFRSCMTLFAHAAPDDDIFREALRRFFGGAEDEATIERL